MLVAEKEARAMAFDNTLKHKLEQYMVLNQHNPLSHLQFHYLQYRVDTSNGRGKFLDTYI
jgi:hypothetical protein